MISLASNLTTLAAAVVPRRGFWMPEQASGFAGSVDAVFMFITWLSIFFFVLIVVLMCYFAWKYRRPANDHTPEAKAATHNTPLELTWTIVPLILVIIIFYVGMQGYIELRSSPADSYEVYVTAQKWSWTFEHRNGAIEAGRLTIPADRPVRLIMQSQDVLHSLFIPAFRVKQDVVPGRYSSLWFEATHPGEYDLFCAEYCGTQHATMNAVVEVVPAEDFPEIIAERARFEPEEGREHIAARERLYARCQACHSLDGTRLTGPSFRETHELWGQERTLDDGTTVTVDENYIRDSILNPRRYTVAGYPDSMPSFQGQLDETQVRALIEFIRRLDEFDDEGRLIEDPDEN